MRVIPFPVDVAPFATSNFFDDLVSRASQSGMLSVSPSESCFEPSHELQRMTVYTISAKASEYSASRKMALSRCLLCRVNR